MGTETRFGERESPGRVVTVAQGSDVLVPVSCALQDGQSGRVYVTRVLSQ